MKKLPLIIIAFLCTTLVFPQNEASNWYFGFGAGIQFNNGVATSVNDGQLFTNEGCVSISDNQGNLLFYSSGTTVYNRNHNVMQNGTGLLGSASATQSAIVVPAPQNPNVYYIFTVDTAIEDGIDLGLNYSIIDISQNGGLGAVTTKNINLLPNCSEKISAVLKDCESESIWVVTFSSQNGSAGLFDSFHAFEVSTQGVSATSVVSTVSTPISGERGYLKLSPDGTKLVSATMEAEGNSNGGLFLYDFDSSTGIVSNEQELFITSNTASNKPYGVEFSPSNRFLYIHSSNDFFSQNPEVNNNPNNHISTLSQFDLEAPDIQASEFSLDQRNLYRGGLQLGPDGKIYRALATSYDIGQPFLGVIHNPNEPGAASNYEHNFINLSPNQSAQGLPPFIQSFFNEQIDIIQNGVSTQFLELCIGDTYTLVAEDIPNATYTWTLDGNPLPETDFDLDINGPGHYEVYIDLNMGDCTFKEGQAFISYFEVPVAESASNFNTCDTDNDSVMLFDFESTTAEVLGVQDPATFTVNYFSSQADADANINALVLPYQNISNPQQIFARIENIGYSGCYDITSFVLEVFDTPIANTLNDVEVCDDDVDGNDMNGQVITDLASFNALVLGNQDDSLFTITYHSSQQDADTNNNVLPLSFYNTTADSEEIFVRIENNNFKDCYDTTSFNLIVNRLPEKFDSTLYQCDQDGNPDGLTIFNLTEANDALTGGLANRSTKFFNSLIDAQNDNNEIDGNAYSNAQSTEILYVQVIDDLTGCFSIAKLTIEVSATNANDAILTECDYDGTEDGIFNFNLSDADTQVLNGLPDNITLQYYETYDDALLEINTLGDTYTNTTPYSQIIYARAENGNACYGINEVQLTVYELPNIETEEERSYCINFFPELITLTSGILGGSIADYTYEWSTGEVSSQIEVNEVGTYSVNVTNANGCSKLRTITVLPSNIATFESIDIVDGTENNTITVNVSGEGNYEFALDDIEGPYQDSNVFTNVAPGFHTVYVRDKNACGIVEQLVSVVGFPKFFTPNGDSYHDTWQVYGVSEQFQPNSKIYIYDRYGKLLKQLDPRGRGWDGTFNGQDMPTSDYWFQVTLEDGRVYKSHFTLKR